MREEDLMHRVFWALSIVLLMAAALFGGYAVTGWGVGSREMGKNIAIWCGVGGILSILTAMMIMVHRLRRRL